MHRGIFYAKAGQAAPLAEHLQEADEQMKGYGIAWETRIYTDYYSGRSGRWFWNGCWMALGGAEADAMGYRLW